MQRHQSYINSFLNLTRARKHNSVITNMSALCFLFGTLVFALAFSAPTTNRLPHIHNPLRTSANFPASAVRKVPTLDQPVADGLPPNIHKTARRSCGNTFYCISCKLAFSAWWQGRHAVRPFSEIRCSSGYEVKWRPSDYCANSYVTCVCYKCF